MCSISVALELNISNRNCEFRICLNVHEESRKETRVFAHIKTDDIVRKKTDVICNSIGIGLASGVLSVYRLGRREQCVY